MGSLLEGWEEDSGQQEIQQSRIDRTGHSRCSLGGAWSADARVASTSRAIPSTAACVKRRPFSDNPSRSDHTGSSIPPTPPAASAAAPGTDTVPAASSTIRSSCRRTRLSVAVALVTPSLSLHNTTHTTAPVRRAPH